MGKIYVKLIAIQSALKAPKSQFNKFGNYHYRKAEDILEAVKPLLDKHGCIITCSDDLQLIGCRYYIKATVTITCAEDGSSVTTTAFAREEEEKKGMDGSQITGASSSYARKYALNGLLCIDDTADSDTTNVGDGKQAESALSARKRSAGRAEKPKEQPAQAPATGYQPLPPEKYWGIVKAYAEGRKTKTGGDYRETWARSTGATEQDILKFDQDVANYRDQMNR